MTRSIFISAGEASGDLHGANLVRSLRARDPDLRCVGFGGEQMADAGVELRENLVDRSVMGVRKVVAEMGYLVDVAARFVEELRSSPPDLVVLIDYPGLNLNLARLARSLGIKVVYYICPQVWAWGPWRVRRIARRSDLLLVILPFEEPLYRAERARVQYVGSPVFDQLHRIEQEEPADLGVSGPILGLFPGSRRQEVEELLPALLGAADSLRKEMPELQVLVSCQRASLKERVRELTGDHGQIRVGPAHEIQRQAHLSLVCSGTATLEQAYFGVPEVVVYPIQRWERSAFSLFSAAPHFGLVNLFSGRRVVPEILFAPGEEEGIARLARPLLRGPERERVQADLAELRQTRFKPGAADRAAEAVLEELPRA